MLAVRPEGVTEKIRLVHASLNLFAPNALTMSKGWRLMANKELTKLWIRVSGKSIDEWVQAVATWCNAPSSTIEDIMLTSDRRRKKPGLNGMYINVPMSCLSAEMRQFLRDCSAELGHEEVALAVWYLRHFIKTGKRLPRYSLENKVPRALDLPHLRHYEAQNRAALYHPEPLAALQESAGDFALSLGGEPEEIEGFVKSCEYWETHNRRYAEENAIVQKPRGQRRIHRLNQLDNYHLGLHRRFANYLKGKSVAILGRGPSLQSCEASVIESYDVVVRTHRPAPVENWWPPPLVQPEWQDKVGSRTDILYSSLGNVNEEFIERVVNSFKDEGGLFLCRPHPWYTMHRLKDCIIMERFMPVRYLDVGLYNELTRALDLGIKWGGNPFPGTLVVADILSHNVSRVFIGGMTCYCDKSDMGIMEGGKKSKCDFNYIRKLWRDNRAIISVDPIMEELFETLDDSVPECAPKANEIYETSADGVVNQYI